MTTNMTTLLILLGCVLILGVLWVYRRGREEGFQVAAAATKPAWLDTSLWTPVNRTRFGWTGLTPSAWFQYDTVNLASLEPIYDADVATIALESNGNDPVKAREALKTKLMDYIDVANRRGTTPQEITPYMSINVPINKIRIRPSDVPATGTYDGVTTPIDPNDSLFLCVTQIIAKDDNGTNVAFKKPVSYTRGYPGLINPAAITDGATEPRGNAFSMCLGTGVNNGTPNRDTDYIEINLEDSFNISSVTYIGRPYGNMVYPKQRNRGVRIELINNNIVVHTLKTPTTDIVQTLSVSKYTTTSDEITEATKPAAIFGEMWTPLHRVMWGLKDGAFDAIEYDLVQRRGETLATADLLTLTQRQTMRTFPSDVAKRALDLYDQDVYVARQRLLAGSAFETGVTAYADISGTLFKDYGILMTRPATIPDAQWTTTNRTMYPVVQKAGAKAGSLVHEYDRAPTVAAQLIPADTAQYMLSITADDPIEARYKYLQNKAMYDAKLVAEKERQKQTSLENIKAKSCAELDRVYDTLEAAKKGLRPTIQDLSGSALVAAGAKDENMRFQKRFFQDCSGTTGASTGPCKDLATQDEGLFSIYTEYEATNTDLFSREIEVLEAIEVVTNTMKLLNCPNPKTLAYSVDKDVGYIDTETLFMKLSELSPYYISPDIIQSLSSAITDTITSSGAGDLKGAVDVIRSRTGAIKSMAAPYA
jgi:hypothetical protein